MGALCKKTLYVYSGSFSESTARFVCALSFATAAFSLETPEVHVEPMAAVGLGPGGLGGGEGGRAVETVDWKGGR